jgi:hypothetical protein
MAESARLHKEAAMLEGVTAETTKPKKTTAKKTKVSV